MSAVTIYHNPKCSKSRATLEILQEKGVELSIIEYLKTPPTSGELTDILRLLVMEPRDLMRKGEEPYSEKNLSDDSLTREQLIDAMISDPILIERPIVLAGGRARIGRPPESVLEIL